MTSNEHTSYQICGTQSCTWRETDNITFLKWWSWNIKLVYKLNILVNILEKQL